MEKPPQVSKQSLKNEDLTPPRFRSRISQTMHARKKTDAGSLLYAMRRDKSVVLGGEYDGMAAVERL
jgi:hypothetical protein